MTDPFKTERTALCLSGGGFRASLFHLGVCRCLHQNGLLSGIDTISGVSGGSIFAGFLARQMMHYGWSSLGQIEDYERQIAEPFHLLVTRDLRTLPVLMHFAWNWLTPRWRVRHLVSVLTGQLGDHALLDIPAHPKFVFNATDVLFGVNWEFGRDRVGDWQAGYTPPPKDLKLAFAVAASACFPPVFGPMRLPFDPRRLKGGDYRKPDRDRLLRRLALTDGGVYDNLGLEPVWRRHGGVIVSDAGAPFCFEVSRTPVLRHLRYTSLFSRGVLALRKRWLMSLISARPRCGLQDREGCVMTRRPGTLHCGHYVGMSSRRRSGTGYSERVVEQRINRIRTDLDRFTEAEIAVLENHGYLIAHARLNTDSRLLRTKLQPPAEPYPAWMDENKVMQALQRSHRRLR